MAHSKESETPNRLNSMKDIKAAWSKVAKFLGLSSEDAETLSKSGAKIPKSVLKMISAGEEKLRKEPSGSPAEMDGAKKVYKLIEKNKDKKKVKKIPTPKPRPTRLKYSSDTAEGAKKQKKARELRDAQASGGKQDTGKNKNKKSDIKTAGMSNKMVVDGANQKVKPKKAKIKVEYGKIIDEAQEEQNLKKGGLVTKRGPMHRSSKRKS